jgi:hypothetical protein
MSLSAQLSGDHLLANEVAVAECCLPCGSASSYAPAVVVFFHFDQLSRNCAFASSSVGARAFVTTPAFGSTSTVIDQNHRRIAGAMGSSWIRPISRPSSSTAKSLRFLSAETAGPVGRSLRGMMLPNKSKGATPPWATGGVLERAACEEGNGAAERSTSIVLRNSAFGVVPNYRFTKGCGFGSSVTFAAQSRGAARMPLGSPSSVP